MSVYKDLSVKDFSALKDLSVSELIQEIKDMEKKYFTLKMKLRLWEQKQTHHLSALKRHIARAKTIANNK